MSPTTGIGHVAILTEDLDRFVEFSTSVFEAEVVFTEATRAFRHARGSWRGERAPVPSRTAGRSTACGSRTPTA